MFTLISIGALLLGQDTDLILRERPTPTAYGGSANMTCDRLEVSVEWKNQIDRGLLVLRGRAAFARKSKDIEGDLSVIKSQLYDVYDVEQSCEDLNKILTIIKGGDKSGNLVSWEMTVRDNFVVELRGPFAEPNQ